MAVSENVQRSDLLQLTTPTRTIFGLPLPRAPATKWPGIARDLVNGAQQAMRDMRRAAAAALPDERADAVRAVASAYLDKLEATAAEVATARRDLRITMATSSAYPSHSAVAYTEALVDLELSKRIAEMPVGERAALVAHCEAAPLENERFTAALVRCPPELSRIMRKQQTAVRVAALKQMKPVAYAALANEAAEAEIARDALRVVSEGLAEAGIFASPAVGAVVRDGVIEWPSVGSGEASG